MACTVLFIAWRLQKRSSKVIPSPANQPRILEAARDGGGEKRGGEAGTQMHPLQDISYWMKHSSSCDAQKITSRKIRCANIWATWY